MRSISLENNALGHDENPGAPGFTGASVRDRLVAQGYSDANASEVATSFSSGTEGVRSLWVLPYHRLGLMHPQAIIAGWGHAETSGRAITVGVIVYDFNAPAPERIRAPAPDQRVAGTYSGEEIPDVVPAGASRPVGYPIMVTYSGARAVDLEARASPKRADASSRITSCRSCTNATTSRSSPRARSRRERDTGCGSSSSWPATTSWMNGSSRPSAKKNGRGARAPRPQRHLARYSTSMVP